jgi:hypothetical protein
VDQAHGRQISSDEPENEQLHPILHSLFSG